MSKSDRRVGSTSESDGLGVVRMALEDGSNGDVIASRRLREQLHMLVNRVQRVQARGGAYAGVGLSGDVKMLLARLEAGRALSSRTH